MKYKAFAPLAVFCCLFSATSAQSPGTGNQPPTGPWQDIQVLALPKRDMEEDLLPEKFRLLELNLLNLTGTLEQALRGSPGENKAAYPLLEMPMPDGTFQSFRIEYAPVMHPALAAKFPEIHSYAGVGVHDPTSKVYFDFSPTGLHALILTAGKAPVIIEPIRKGNIGHYLNYYDHDWGTRHQQLACAVLDAADRRPTSAGDALLAGDCQLRTYQLAIATTAEFTATSISPTDLTGVTTTLANINALVTFINGIFINEFAIRLQLVANNNLLIFTNAATDGYTNGNQNTMAGDAENQAVVDATIGAGNYDLAHAFGTNATANSGSGVSQQIGNVCVNGNKANAATIMNPALPFNFRALIMHEMGHQFGANHTFNEASLPICSNAGQLVAATAYEPGSGSTIMSYSGTCGASNVQGFRDQYFHTISLQEVGNYVTAGSGSLCPNTVALANSAPTVSAVGAAYNIPAGTPFRLTATGNDADGDLLTFCWEQFDNQLITHPPQSTATNGPVFRTFLPTPSPTRYFPNLPAILTGATPVWEVLPSVGRTMNFTVTARDNAPGGGCTDEDNTVVTVVGTAGPFLINSTGPDAACLLAEDNTVISWNIANTNAAPINCTNVDIWLSLDGGTNFTVLLVGGTPNDGSQQVTIPANAITTKGRIMVIGTGNIFFDINDNDIRIDCPMNRTVTDNPAIGIYKVRIALETMGTVVVPPAATTRFYAGEKITLKPGFWAQLSGDFQAAIKPCDPCVATKPAQLMAEKENPRVYYYEEPNRERTNGHTGSPLQARAFPNPFDQNFTLRFEQPVTGKVDILLTDIAGRFVQTVYTNDHLEAGIHQIPITASQLQNGLYDCRILSNGHQVQIKLVKID